MLTKTTCCHKHSLPHACMWIVFNSFMRKWPQIAEKEKSLSTDDGEDSMSSGSGHASEEPLEVALIPVVDSGEEAPASMMAGIAALAKGQAILLEKFSILEKIVGTVQFDMTWVRDDMKAVQQAVDKIANQVADIREASAEGVQMKVHVTEEGSPNEAWNGQENVVEGEQSPSMSLSRGNQHGGGDGALDSNAGHNEAANDIEEMQTFVTNTGMPQTGLEFSEAERSRNEAANYIEETQTFVTNTDMPQTGFEFSEADRSRSEAANYIEETQTFVTNTDMPQTVQASTEAERSGNSIANYIEETQTFIPNTDMPQTVLATVEAGRRDWGYARTASRALFSPQCQQKRVSMDQLLSLEEESQELEMSCQSTQQQTPAMERSLWADYTAAVRDWPQPTARTTGREEGWMSAKKGRWDLTNYGKDTNKTVSTPLAPEDGTLNLNLLPERLAAVLSGGGEGMLNR